MKQIGYGSAVAFTPGTPISPPYINDLPIQGIIIVATVAGNVNMTLSGGTVITIAVPIGTTYLPLSVASITNGGLTTATATYYALA